MSGGSLLQDIKDVINRGLRCEIMTKETKEVDKLELKKNRKGYNLCPAAHTSAMLSGIIAQSLVSIRETDGRAFVLPASNAFQHGR